MKQKNSNWYLVGDQFTMFQPPEDEYSQASEKGDILCELKLAPSALGGVRPSLDPEGKH